MLKAGSTTGSDGIDNASGALLAALVQSAGDAIVCVDRQGTITAWNPAAQQLFGFTPPEAGGKPLADLLGSGAGHAQILETLQKLARGEGPFHYEGQRQKKDGPLIDVSVTAFGLRNQADEIVGAAAIYRDITQRKQIEAELTARLDQEQALAVLSQHALAAEELAALLAEAAVLLADSLKVDLSQVLELAPDGQRLSLRAGVGWKPGVVGQATVPAGTDSLAGFTLLSRQPVIVEDLGSETRFHASQLLRDHNVVSGLGAVIGDTQRPYGVVGAFTLSSRKFTRRDTDFLQAIANVIALTAKRLSTQHELRSGETYFRSLIDNSFDVIVVLDPEGTIGFENAAMRRVFGYEPTELIGKIGFDFVHPQEAERARQAVAEALRSGASKLECRVRRKDGAWLYCEMAITRVLDPQGRQAAVVSVRDITEGKQAEQAQSFLASIVESSHVAIVGTTQDGKIASWNRAAEELYGYRAAEILGQPLELLLPQGEAGGAELIAQAKLGEHRGLHDVRRRRKDGAIITLSVSHSPILDAGGAIVGMASFERSPTEETRLEQELQKAHAYTRGLIESSLDAMLMVGSDLVITDVNEQTLKLIGSTRDRVVGSRFDAYFTQPERAAEGIRRTLSEGYVANYDLALKPAAGPEILVSFNAAVYRDPTGQPLGVFAVARDVTQQKQLEAQLRQAQTYTRRLIESSVDAMLTVDSGQIINDVNERMATLVETPKTMLIGSRFDRLFTDPERAAAGVAQALKEGSITNYDLNLRTLSGKEILVSFNASIFYDAAGKSQGIFGVARDVTEQRRRDQQLSEQQIYSRSLIESSIDALLAVNPQLNITDINEQTVRLSGYPRPELIGSSFPILFTDPERAAAGVRQALAAGFMKDYELTLRSAAGAEVPVSFNASTFQDAHGKVLGILAAARDIGERRRLERERSLLASIVTTSPDAIYSYGPDTIITSWNAGAERLFGYSATEMIGRSMTICVPLERRAELLERLNLVMAGKGVQQFETQRRRKDGGLMDVSVTISPIAEAQGNVTAIAAIYRDITERKRFELELTKARDEALEGARVRSEFLANMSHEIRTPLNSITGMADMLLDTPLSEEQRRRLLSVKDNAGGLLAILKDILDFSKLSTSKISFQTVDFELEQVFHATLSPFADAARRKGLEVIASIEPDTPQSLRGDPDRLRQVLANLLSNAVKFTERGEILVRVSKLSESPAAATLRFEVRDTGIGIPAAEQPRLFSAFTQVEGTARQYGGTGLGLAIAHRLVECMRGSMGVASRPGLGSTFWFTAKLFKQPAVPRQIPGAPLNLEEVRALIVDDRGENLEVLSNQLRSWKMNPDTAPGPVEALEMMRRQAQQRRPYALALLDMEMPEMDGVELARQIRRLPEIAETPLAILSSAPKTPELLDFCAELDIKSILLKPVKQSELLDCIAGLLSRSRPASAQPAHSPEKLKEPAIVAPISGLQGHPLRVLLAEDNAANREVGLWQLQKLGCLADAVVNGGEALEAAAKTQYDVILMDCRMPVMDGYEATRRIREHEGSVSHTPIIAMTAHALSGDQEKCLAAGMDDYLSKPVTLERLSAALHRVMDVATAAAAPAPALAGDGSGEQRQVLDPATMASLRAQGGLLPKLIGIALAEMPEQLKQIADALAAHNHADAAVAAHSIKGTAKLFGATRMTELAERLEQEADAGAAEAAGADFEHLRGECQRVSHELEAQRARQPD